MQAVGSAPAPDAGGEATELLQPPIAESSIHPAKPPAPRRRVIWGILLIAVILVGAVGLYVRAQLKARAAAANVALAIPTITVSTGDITSAIRVSGTVAAQNFAQLLAPRIVGSRSMLNRGGTGSNFGGSGSFGNDFNLVLLHLANPGEQVKTGDVVGEFDPQFQQQRYDDYKDSVVQLENSIKKLVANLAATKEAHDQTVRSARADWDKAVLDLQTAPIRSQIDAEKYKLAVEQAEATYKQLVFESSLVEESQRAAIRASELNREQSRIELQRAETNVKRMTVKSPMNGIVVMASIVRNGEFGQVREGDQVNAGQPFITIVDPSSMVLNATVNQVDAQRLRMGMKTAVRLDAYPGLELPGTLIGIGAMSKTSIFRAGFVGEIPIRVKIDQNDARLIPDLTGSADVVLSVEKDTLALPRSAIFEEGGAPFVFVQGPEGWTRAKVELGLTSFTQAAIRSGVQKGDVVALQRPM